jgi:hypothetical protein
VTARKATWLFPHRPIDPESVRLFPRRAFDRALEEARETQELEQRRLSAAELEALRDLYPDAEYTQDEAVLTYQTLGRHYDPGPMPTWEEIEFKLSAEPVKEAKLPRKAGRPWGSEMPIPTDTFWSIFELAVVEEASARRIARDTGADRKMSFVNRDKAGRLVKWVADHPTAARAALRGREIPKGFLATPAGVLLPKL